MLRIRDSRLLCKRAGSHLHRRATSARETAARCKNLREMLASQRIPGFPKKSYFLIRLFYPSRRLGISSRFSVHLISSSGAVYHHGGAVHLSFLQLDDIQCSALMICNSYEIDDIQGLRLDFGWVLWYNKLTDK